MQPSLVLMIFLQGSFHKIFNILNHIIENIKEVTFKVSHILWERYIIESMKLFLISGVFRHDKKRHATTFNVFLLHKNCCILSILSLENSVISTLRCIQLLLSIFIIPNMKQQTRAYHQYNSKQTKDVH